MATVVVEQRHVKLSHYTLIPFKRNTKYFQYLVKKKYHSVKSFLVINDHDK